MVSAEPLSEISRCIRQGNLRVWRMELIALVLGNLLLHFIYKMMGFLCFLKIQSGSEDNNRLSHVPN